MVETQNDDDTRGNEKTWYQVKRCIFDEYRIKKTPSKADYRKKNNPLNVFDHQIHQTLATDVTGVSFDAQ